MLRFGPRPRYNYAGKGEPQHRGSHVMKPVALALAVCLTLGATALDAYGQ